MGLGGLVVVMVKFVIMVRVRVRVQVGVNRVCEKEKTDYMCFI